MTSKEARLRRKSKMQQMEQSGMSRAEIGRKCDVSREYVRQILGNIYTQPKRICKWCSESFIPRDVRSMCCCPRHNKFWNYYNLSRQEHLSDKFNCKLSKISHNILATNTEECWEWVGKCNFVTGYGAITLEGKQWSTHRLIWTMAIGEIPPNICVLHKCDYRKCVNPRHLFLGTQSDNMKDRDRKGRRRAGPLFTQSDIHRIRSLFKSNKDLPGLSKEYNVDPLTILRIVKYRTYKNI